MQPCHSIWSQVCRVNFTLHFFLALFQHEMLNPSANMWYLCILQLSSWAWNCKTQWFTGKHWCKHWRSSDRYWQALNFGTYSQWNVPRMKFVMWSLHGHRMGYRSVSHRYCRGNSSYAQCGKKCMSEINLFIL